MSSILSFAVLAFVHALNVAAAPALRVRAAPPATFTANNAIGPGGSSFTDSAHFRVYGETGTTATNTLNMLEGAYSCFVDTLGWRSSGLAFNDATDADGPWTKVNIYSVSTLSGGAAGVMHSDYKTGMSWLEVVNQYTAIPGVTVHEFGHGMTYHAKTWVEQGRTGAWWETVANWYADTYKTSPLCAEGRSKFGQSTSATEINLNKVIGDSFQVLVDGSAGSGNYYEAWPFLSYLTYNADKFAGLGTNTIRESFVQYSKGSNETPLHTFARLSTGATIQKVVGRYWARMAFVDIGHPTAQSVFLSQRSRINYANLDSQGNGVYKVKSARQPKYMGANIVPLKKSGAVSVSAKITTSGTYTATLSIRNTSSGATRYVDFVNGSASASVSADEEAAVVVANTPALILYDPFQLSGEVAKGLDYTLTLTGATA
ncbi:hypothetical protein CC86DRAFT_341687 [Ophiobolus disseminans]|uniref:Dockerin type 1 n=1 Tax=Ophiobolus disseminans TaxID=1469910 RepID=A0A6A7AES5_9PLEO|nr:hypothetical protein CC86DRAFT_341687 [Ophiobolus disseminans]